MSETEQLALRLRAAGERLRARPDDEVLAVLGAMLESWRDPAGPWQEALAAELAEHAGFSKANVREGLRLALADWNEAALQRLIERELGPRRAAAHCQ